MIVRFCAYAVLRNLRFFEPFLVLFLLHDAGLSYLGVGALLAYEKVLSGALEVPLGVATDRWGRRRALVLSFTLAAAAFAVFGLAAGSAHTLPLLYLGQTLYGVAEALRSGTHKAIILDWLDGEGRADEGTAVIGTTRFFSKTAGGASALLAGGLVFATGGFTPLFWAAIVPTLACAAMISTYPARLEGDLGGAAGPRPALWAGLKDAARRPGVGGLVLASVLFESQVKLALAFLQPYLAGGLDAIELDVVGGVGALAYGAWFFVQGLAAGFASLGAPRLERAAGGPRPALRWAHGFAAVGLLLAGALATWAPDWRVVGLLAFVALAALQNARRPILVAALGAVMDKRYRATTLSVEAQARSWTYALTAVSLGALADHAGLGAAFLGMGAVVACARFFDGPQPATPSMPPT